MCVYIYIYVYLWVITASFKSGQRLCKQSNLHTYTYIYMYPKVILLAITYIDWITFLPNNKLDPMVVLTGGGATSWPFTHFVYVYYNDRDLPMIRQPSANRLVRSQFTYTAKSWSTITPTTSTTIKPMIYKKERWTRKGKGVVGHKDNCAILPA